MKTQTDEAVRCSSSSLFVIKRQLRGKGLHPWEGAPPAHSAPAERGLNRFVTQGCPLRTGRPNPVHMTSPSSADVDFRSSRNPSTSVEPSTYLNILIAHGVFMGSSILMLTVGASFMAARVGQRPWVTHALAQVMSVVVAIIGIAFGYATSGKTGSSYAYASSHNSLGIIVFIAMIAHAASGFLIHFIYMRLKRTQRPWWNMLHIWIGRVLIIAAAINAGLGLVIPVVDISIGYAILWWVASLIFIIACFVFIRPRFLKFMSQRPPGPILHGNLEMF